MSPKVNAGFGLQLLVQYRTLGRTGIKVSPYALGALMFGASIGNPDHDDSIRIIHKALDAGINFIDTADVYSRRLRGSRGKALKGRRDNVVLATKLSRPMGDDPNQQGASRRWIMTAVENSLRRLQTDHIDLYQIHRPDPDTDIEETLSALSDLIHSGKVRAIGSSTTPASDIVEAQWVAERRGLERFHTEQPPYSILNRGIESEVLPLAQRYGMGTLVWGPLGQGMLTGRVRKGQQNDLRRASLFRHLSDERRRHALRRRALDTDRSPGFDLGEPDWCRPRRAGKAAGMVGSWSSPLPSSERPPRPGHRRQQRPRRGDGGRAGRVAVPG